MSCRPSSPAAVDDRAAAASSSASSDRPSPSPPTLSLPLAHDPPDTPPPSHAPSATSRVDPAPRRLPLAANLFPGLAVVVSRPAAPPIAPLTRLVERLPTFVHRRLRRLAGSVEYPTFSSRRQEQLLCYGPDDRRPPLP